jgi:serine/threonine protein kinase
MLIDEKYDLKITDFGFASFSKEELTNCRGTPMYIAPEIILGERYKGDEVDVFSLGVVLFAMVSGKPPFKCAHMKDVRYKMLIDKNYSAFWKHFE